MPYRIETAAVTRKPVSCEFNGDNINMNGKVLSIDSANNGFKGAGKMGTPFAVALASSNRNGFAGAALTAFNDRMVQLKESGDSFPNILAEYFSDSQYALEKSGCDLNGLSTSVFYGYDDKLVAARMGDVGLFRYSRSVLTHVGYVPTEGESMPRNSCELIEDLADGDLFFLCSKGITEYLKDEEIVRLIGRGNADAKVIAQYLAAAAAKRNDEQAITVLVIKIISEGLPVVPVVAPVAGDEIPSESVADIPVSVPEEPVFRENTVPVSEPETYIPEAVQSFLSEEPPVEIPEEEPVKKGGGLKRFLMVLALLAAMIVVLFASYKLTGMLNERKNDAATAVTAGVWAQYDVNASGKITEIDSAVESTTQEESTTAVAESTTTEEKTTVKEETTRATAQTTVRQTEAEEEEADDDEDYYDYEDDDDEEKDDEDKDDVTTTKVPEVTTQIPVVTTQAPVVTEAPTTIGGERLEPEDIAG